MCRVAVHRETSAIHCPSYYPSHCPNRSHVRAGSANEPTNPMCDVAASAAAAAATRAGAQTARFAATAAAAQPFPPSPHAPLQALFTALASLCGAAR